MNILHIGISRVEYHHHYTYNAHPSETAFELDPQGRKKGSGKGSMTTIPIPPVKRVALYQIAVLLSGCALLQWWNPVLAYSALLGGLIQICPQAWFTRQAFRYVGARNVQSIVRAMYWGETGKVVLTAVLFVTVFLMVRPLSAGALFISFVVMILVQFVSVVRLFRR